MDVAAIHARASCSCLMAQPFLPGWEGLVTANGEHVELCTTIPIDNQRVLNRFGLSKG
jgi:hypothetical protein